VWRIYTLLAGLAELQDGENNTRLEQDVFTGLDWKRVFGLYLWYGTGIEASIADVVAAYERLTLQHSKSASTDIARPIPKWAAASSGSKKGFQLPSVAGPGLGLYMTSGIPKDIVPEDPLYVLIKLHADPALSLTNALNPLSFAPSAMDWGIGMCWHLYVILSRVMRVRDFADRGDPGVRIARVPAARGRGNLVNGFGGGSRSVSSSVDERSSKDGEDEYDIQPDGHSPTADLLASSYAFELESWGMIQEAAFVLLHLEGSVG
jgi:nuclear pore complex protein Nup98-Nup96